MYTTVFIDALVEESQRILEESRVDSSPYETINDESPSGTGVWSFGLDTYPQNPMDYARMEKNGKIIDITGKYADAVKQVQRENPSAKVIYVLP